jgi:hypothetical protein
VQRLLLTDDELWQAIAKNTDAMSALVHEQIELEADATRGIIAIAGQCECSPTRTKSIGLSTNIRTTLPSFAVATPK